MGIAMRVAAIVAMAACFSCAAAHAANGAANDRSLSLIPFPAHVEIQSGQFIVQPGTPVLHAAGDADGEWVADYFIRLVNRTRHLALKPMAATRATTHAIVLKRLSAGTTGDEGYRLTITPKQIVIAASTRAGELYGCITLWQLMMQRPGPGGVALPALEIEDAPRFAWRGLMLDSVRHFQSVAFVKSFIDQMALHKLNVLHWHLTDDQGWRIEIKKYPRLTQIGAWRVPAGAGPATDIDPTTGKPRLYGGYYTQLQIRDIVAYAAARNITIVPEIEMPGHATAAIVAYPQLGSLPDVPSQVPSDWGIYRNLYNIDDSTFAFLEDVLMEVMALFPGRYIHIGGDEAVKDQWKASPKIQAQMHAMGITDEDALQSWFMRRIETFLAAHGRRLIGWDEILQGGIAPNATVMSWRGIDGAIAAAKAGHDAVLSPAPTLYLDNRQGLGPEEPSGRGTLVTLADVYNFDPAPASLSPEQRQHILGVQANIWTEHIRTEPQVEYMAYPRAAALAEVAWSAAAAHNWPGFLARMPAEFDRYRAFAMPYAPSAFIPRIGIDGSAASGRATATFSTQTNFGDIRYTMDGTLPNILSERYAVPLNLHLPSQLRGATFVDGRMISPIVTRNLDGLSVSRRDSRELSLCSQNLPLALEDDAPVSGPRAVFLVDVMNPCWIYKSADLDRIGAIQAAVGQVPFNFQIGDDVNKIKLRPPHSPGGELEVHLDTCDGPEVATLSLAPALANDAVTNLRAPMAPETGTHDLCFVFTQSKLDPLWVIDWVELVPAVGNR
jgi:hexosaminidase